MHVTYTRINTVFHGMPFLFLAFQTHYLIDALKLK